MIGIVVVDDLTFWHYSLFFWCRDGDRLILQLDLANPLCFQHMGWSHVVVYICYDRLNFMGTFRCYYLLSLSFTNRWSSAQQKLYYHHLMLIQYYTIVIVLDPPFNENNPFVEFGQISTYTQNFSDYYFLFLIQFWCSLRHIHVPLLFLIFMHTCKYMHEYFSM